MEKGKSCYKKTIPTVEGGFKIRICEDREAAEKESRKENDGKTWEDAGK